MCSGDDQEALDGRAIPSFTRVAKSALAILSLSGASRRGFCATGGPGVFRM